jgi:RND family efflux transporter MFP subunit
MTIAESEPSKRGKLANCAIVCGLLAIMACGEGNVYVPPPPPRVTVSQPERQQVADYLEFTGNTEAIKTVQLKARVQGYLEKILFKDGDMVKKDQLLFIIQQNTYQDQLAQAEAQILQQKANYDHAVIETARYTRLVQQKAAAQTDLDNWRFSRDAYLAGMKNAQAAQKLAKLNLDYTEIRAPFDGRMGRHLVDEGNLVGAGEFTVLASINQIDPLYAYFTMNERDLYSVVGQTGIAPAQAQNINIPLYLGLVNETGYPHEGHLDFAAITLNPTTGTLTLRGIFPNPDGKIMSGSFARLRILIVGSQKTSLVIPEVAIGYDQLGSYVMVVGDHNIVERRSVKLGPRVNSRRVVQEGLTGEEWVIVEGQLDAIAGRPVTPVRQAPEPKKTEATAPANPRKDAP